MNQTLLDNLRRFFALISPRRKRQLPLLIAGGLVSSVFEMLSLAAMIPFIGVLLNPAGLYGLPVVGVWLQSLELSNLKMTGLITTSFCVVILASGAIRVGVLYACNRFCFGLGRDMTDEIYAKTLQQSYATHMERNSAEVINVLTTSANEVIFYVVLPCLTITISALSIAAIGASLAWLVPGYALVALLAVAVVYVLIVRFLKGKLHMNSLRITSGQVQYQKQIQESLGAIREIIIDQNQPMFLRIFKSNNRAVRAAQAQNQFMSQSPRYLLETMGVVIIAAIAYAMTIQNSSSSDVTFALSTLAVIALGLQRLLPLAQTSYQSWAMLNGSKTALEKTLQLMDQPEPMPHTDGHSGFSFERFVDLRDVDFSYPGKPQQILNAVSLRIPAGAWIGIVGTTGSGKSTLLDILLGLRSPTSGEVLVDDVPIAELGAGSWRSCVAHVPQTTYLMDASVRANIAFTYDEQLIDDTKIHAICKLLDIESFIMKLSEGYLTNIGERGVQLSGGQRQRLAIARALYKSARILILDEATSALDESTERQTLLAIQSIKPRLTVVCVTHRLQTLQLFDQIYQITDGRIYEIAKGNPLNS
jgi:ATP-binding cassette, subfamily B, bacterial PglK